jgi:catechol 2,3-dioxygenase-like lactoylglutathione lyase family enzyme
MQPLTLDHVAFWVADRHAVAGRCEEWLGMHVIDRQERFTLLGTSARHGKLTLFDADGPRDAGAFGHLELRVGDLGAARSRLPAGTPELFDLGEGIRVRLVEGRAGEVDYDFGRVVLFSRDPDAAAGGYERLGFRRGSGACVEVGEASIELIAGAPAPAVRPLLNHLAVLVASAEAHRLEALELGIEVESTVEAANTRAVFLWGPDGVRVEFVEHKSTFSLV